MNFSCFPAFLIRSFLICAICVIRGQTLFAGDDKTVRDASGAIVSTSQKTATGTTARDASGAVTEHRSTRKNTDGSQTVTVRDASGKVIRTEEKKKK